MVSDCDFKKIKINNTRDCVLAFRVYCNSRCFLMTITFGGSCSEYREMVRVRIIHPILQMALRPGKSCQ
jgi:hypothetical protein